MCEDRWLNLSALPWAEGEKGSRMLSGRRCASPERIRLLRHGRVQDDVEKVFDRPPEGRHGSWTGCTQKRYDGSLGRRNDTHVQDDRCSCRSRYLSVQIQVEDEEEAAPAKAASALEEPPADAVQEKPAKVAPKKEKLQDDSYVLRYIEVFASLKKFYADTRENLRIDVERRSRLRGSFCPCAKARRRSCRFIMWKRRRIISFTTACTSPSLRALWGSFSS